MKPNTQKAAMGSSMIAATTATSVFMPTSRFLSNVEMTTAAATGLPSSYWSVRRFVATLQQTSTLPFRRLECDPWEETQIDFGTAAPIRTADGKTRRPWVLRVVLSHSRKAYSEVVYRNDPVS